MRRFLAPLLLLVGLLLGSVGIAQAQAQSCTELDLDAAVQKGGQLTTLLKIANFRGDVKYMGDVASELESFLTTCGDEDSGRLALVCNYDCHLQLGRYSLFLASELPYLSSASGISRNDSPLSPLSPQKSQEIAERGLQDVERGLRFLARQQAGSGGSAEAAESGYREFVRQLVLLTSLKIQLTMNEGDNWYQTVSEARVKQLDFFVADALGSTPGAGVASQPNLSKAYALYEAAMWALVETRMDIPDETTYDDLRTDLYVLEKELQDRMDSIRKGFLFVGIDPLQFTTIKFEDLQAKIAESRIRLEGIEEKVEAIVQRWHADQQGETTRQLDEGRTIRSQEVNLIAHKIGKLENESEQFSLSVQQEINKVDAEKDTFSFRQQIRQLEMSLATKMAEFQNQQQQLEGRKELDLLVLSKEAEVDRRSELRWLLSWEMTKMNLDMQMASIETQITEYQRQIDRNKNERDQLRIQVSQKQDAIEISQNSIARSELQKAQIAARQTATYLLRRKVAREGICQIEQQLAFVGATPASPFTPIAGEQPCAVPAPVFTETEYNQKMCGDGMNIGLREKLNQEHIRARAFVLQCIVGTADFADLKQMVGSDQIIVDGKSDNPTLPEGVTVDCGKFTQTETDFAKKIWDAELANIEKQAADLSKQRDEIDEQIKFFEDWSAGFLNTIQGLQIGVTTAEGIVAALSAVPETTVAAAGLASGVYTTIKVAEPAMKALDAVRNVLDTALKVGTVSINTINQIKTLTRQLTAIRQQNEQIDFVKALKAVALHKTHFDLAGQRAEGLNEIKELMLQDSIADIDCQSQTSGLAGKIATLQSEHARQVAALELTANENDLLNFDAQDQDLLIAQAQGEISISQQEIDRLTLADSQLANDTTVLDSLVDGAKARLEQVRQVTGKVTDLADRSNQSTNIINELRERQKQSMLALSDQEMGYLEQRIGEEKSNTTELVDGLNKALGLGLKSRSLQDSILAFQQNIKTEVAKQQEEMTKLVSQIDDADVRNNLFITDQETLSDLLKGIPEYVVSKRRLLQTANLNLHLMRQRYALVAGITGAQQDWPSTYVRNATQLGAMIDDIANKRFFDEHRIQIASAQIVIPANSGFARSLAQTGHVEFEVSPAASTEDMMKKLGYFSLWNAAKFKNSSNMSLIDMLVGVQYPCTGVQRNKFVLSHEGSGMVFKALAQGSPETVAQLQIGPQRSDEQTFFDLASSQNRVDNILNYWERRFQVRQFPPAPGPDNDPESILPLLGAPMIGSYSLDVLPGTCGYDGAVYTIYFIYSSGFRPD